MTDDPRDRKAASLSGALLARKGAAAVSGFARAPHAATPPPAEFDHPRAGNHGSEIAHRHTPTDLDPTDLEMRKQPGILIVEDDPLNMKMLTDLFEGHGYRALCAVNGQEAIIIARARQPDVIVMEIKLPGLSGLDVIGQLKRDGLLMDIPVVAVTSRTRVEDQIMIRGAGFDEVLSKPFSVQSMLITVAGFLR
jgi:two-component system cell cycle response regulator DivK